MHVVRRGLFLLLLTALLFVTSPSSAQTGATLVAIITSEPNAPLTRRVRHELEGLGVDVIVLKPPAEASAMRAPLEQAARNVGAVAAIRLVVSSEGKVEVWVADRVTGKTVVRELDATGTNASDATVAVGTVELFRASLMELHTAEPPKGEVAPTPKVSALALPTQPKVPQLGLSVGGGADLGLGGTGISPTARLGAWLRLSDRVGLSLLGSTTLSAARTQTASGSVDVSSQIVGVAMAYDMASADATWVPQLSLGIAAGHVSTSGVAVPPYSSASADAWAAMPYADVGLGFAFTRGLRLRADALAAWAIPQARVQTPTTNVGHWGAPLVGITLGVEVLWASAESRR
jgi:hypothetical protein